MRKSCSGSGIYSSARFRYFLPVWIFRKELAAGRSCWETVTERALQEGYRGLEIPDRRLLRLSAGEAEKIVDHIQKRGLEVVLAMDTDFTAPGEPERSQEIRRTIRRLQWAGSLGIALTRLTTGGQKLSLAGLIRTLQPVAPFVSQTVETFFTRPLVAQGLRKLRRPGKNPVPAGVLARVSESLRGVSSAAEKSGLLVVLENHWGVSSDWRNLEAIMKAVSSPALGICLDWGNFPDRNEVLPGIRGLLPWALHQHAKSYGFGSPEQRSLLPYREIVRQVHRSGYAGALTVEYEGPGDPWSGCRQTREMIENYFRETSD
jgi:sugar phosphate isomerase/epimerase